MLSRLTRVWPHFLIIMASLLVGLIILEFGVRLLSFHVHGRWGGNCHQYVEDLAWDLESYCQLKPKDMRDAQGHRYVMRYSTDHLGARMWGDPESDRLKVLIVGDSFTEADTVSDDKTYFAVLKNETNFEVFANGVGGYGTLQELMKTQQLLKEVVPDIFILQFCGNDFENNSMPTERRLITGSQQTRPYLVDGQIQYGSNKIYTFGLRHSRLFNRIDTTIQHIRYLVYGGYHAGEPPERDVETTRRLLAKFREILPPETDLYAFSCQGLNEGEDAASAYIDFVEAARGAGFTIIDGVADAAVEHEHATGETIRAADGGHLNELGNALWGTFLAEYLKQRYER